MRIDIVTLFPEFLRPMIEGSILGRAQLKGVASVELHDLWRFVPEGERADDAPYGGGPGMVMRLGPIVDCLEHLLGGAKKRAPPVLGVLLHAKFTDQVQRHRPKCPGMHATTQPDQGALASGRAQVDRQHQAFALRRHVC